MVVLSYVLVFVAGMLVMGWIVNLFIQEWAKLGNIMWRTKDGTWKPYSPEDYIILKRVRKDMDKIMRSKK